LTHWIIIQRFNWLTRHGPQNTNWSSDWTSDVLTLAAVFGVSVAIHHLIELPARKWGRRLAHIYRESDVRVAVSQE
jgi:peptidoglycan/LPS O-acetylase OafA/YrhL